MKTNILLPDFSLEQRYDGAVAGIDEVGRGPWAGPVVAAAVIFKDAPTLEGIKDSKKVSPKKRALLFDAIHEVAYVGVGMCEVEEIDTLNILGATKAAMQRAVQTLPIVPQAALVDGNSCPELPCVAEAVIKGDNKSLSIAAASIIAKVTRDRIMHELHQAFPHFGWDSNAGYGTKQHSEGIAKHGITEHHRRSFAPIRKYIEENDRKQTL